MRKSFFVFLVLLNLSFRCYSQTSVSGNLFSNTTWTKSQSPYTVVGDVGIADGVTLTIEAGVEVYFAGNYQILIKGSIKAIGTESDTIKFFGNGLSEKDGYKKSMILLKNTNLSNSEFKYLFFSGNQVSLRVGDENRDAQASIKNTGTLSLLNSTLKDSYILSNGYETTAQVFIKNCEIFNGAIEGGFSSEPIFVDSCLIKNSHIYSLYKNKGVSINRSSVYNSKIGIEEAVKITDSKIYDSPTFPGVYSLGGYGYIEVDNSILTNSPISLPSGKVKIVNSEIHNNGAIPIIPYRTETIFNPPTLKAYSLSVENSKFYGSDSTTCIMLPSTFGNNDRKASIQNSQFINHYVTIQCAGTFDSFAVSNSCIFKNKLFHIQNLTGQDLVATNCYWGTTDSSTIENKIYHYYDDLDLGRVLITPILPSYDGFTLPPPLSIEYEKLNSSKYNESNGVINLSVTGGKTPYSYKWSNGFKTEDISNLTPGDYTIVVTDAFGETVSKTITIGSPLFVEFISQHISQRGKNDGSINLSIFGGNAPYAFNWSNGATTEDLVNLSAGTYTVKVTDSNGDTIKSAISITEPIGTFYTLSGHVFVGSTPLVRGVAIVFIKKADSIIPYQFTSIDNGAYKFKDLPVNDYLLYAIPEPTLACFPTYYGNETNWKDARSIHLFGNTFEVDIQLVQISVNNKGTGSITGTLTYEGNEVSEESLYKNDWFDLRNDGLPTTNSAKNISVVLLSKNKPIAWTLSNNRGYFEFAGIQTGQYEVSFEKAGCVSENKQVELSVQNPNYSNINASIQRNHIVLATDPEKIRLVQKVFQIYPNPVSANFNIISESEFKYPLKVTISSSVGNKVFENVYTKPNGNNFIEIESDNLTAGMYLLKINYSGGTFNTKIIKR